MGDQGHHVGRAGDHQGVADGGVDPSVLAGEQAVGHRFSHQVVAEPEPVGPTLDRDAVIDQEVKPGQQLPLGDGHGRGQQVEVDIGAGHGHRLGHPPLGRGEALDLGAQHLGQGPREAAGEVGVVGHGGHQLGQQEGVAPGAGRGRGPRWPG